MSLQERLRRSQELTATAGTNELAADKGLAAPPTTSTGVGALGGTPQQQAMAGTPAQKKGAIASALAPAPVIAAPTGETGIEKAKATQAPAAIDTAKQAEMQRYSQSLGTFGDKVNQWIESVISTTLTTAKPKLELTEKAQADVNSALSTLPAGDQARVNTALAALQNQGGLTTETTARDAILTLNQLLGKDTTSELLVGTQYAELWRNIEESIGTQTEAALQTTAMGADKVLTLSDIQDIGTSYDELGQLLGITPAEAQKLTIGQLQQKLADVQQTSFGETAQTAAQMGSAFLSETERQALRGTMRQLEEAGIVGIETQFQQLLDDIDAGQNVSIGNKNYTIDQLLADNTFSDLIGDVFAGTDPALIQSIKEEEPALYDFLMTNQNALVTLRAAGEGRADELRDFNLAADETRKIFDGTTLLAQAGITDPNYLTGTVIPVGTALDWAKGGKAIADLVSLPPEQKQAAVTSLQNATNVVQDNGGSPDDVKKILALDLATATNSKFQSNLTNAWISYSNSQNALQSDDAQTLIDALFVSDPSIDIIQSQLQEDALLAAAGQPTSEYWNMDKNKDGTLDVAELQALAKGRGGKPDVNAIASGKGYQGMDSIKTTIPKVPSYLGPGSPLREAWDNDGKVTADELAGMSLPEITELFNIFQRPGEKGKAQGKIAPAVRDAYLKALDREKSTVYGNLGFDATGTPPGLMDTINAGMAEYAQTQYSQNLINALPVLQNAIGALERELGQVQNADLRWRIQQDIAGLRPLWEDMLVKLAPKDTTPSEWVQTKNQFSEAGKQLGADISGGAKYYQGKAGEAVGGAVEKTIVNPIRKSYRI